MHGYTLRRYVGSLFVVFTVFETNRLLSVEDISFDLCTGIDIANKSYKPLFFVKKRKERTSVNVKRKRCEIEDEVHIRSLLLSSLIILFRFFSHSNTITKDQKITKGDI